MDQRRPADHLLPGRRAGDQARVHRRAPRQPAFGRVLRSPPRSAAWRCRPRCTSSSSRSGPWAHGWGVPMATDTAFAVALIVMLGQRVPVELRIFLTAAAIVDDLGAIVVVALFYSSKLDPAYLLAAAAITGVLVAAQPLRRLPRDAVWAARHRALGLRPCRRPARDARRRDPRARGSDAAAAEPQSADGAGRIRFSAPRCSRGKEVLRHGPSEPALRALDAIHDRLESPADRTLRAIEPWSSFAVLPAVRARQCGRRGVGRMCSRVTAHW